MAVRISTKAWVLAEGPEENITVGGRKGDFQTAREPGALQLEDFDFDDLSEDEVMYEPIYGAWEGNMGHALARSPIDICRTRGERKVVLGNSGVARVLRTGAAVSHLKEGDVCLFAGVFPGDEFGYMIQAHGFDAPNTIGLLTKRGKANSALLTKLPPNSRFTLRQWAAFSLRYLTAWSNWKVALGALRLQVSEAELPRPHVWGWGGGTTHAELRLAQLQGCSALMISGSPGHLDEIRRSGLATLDRSELGILGFDERRSAKDEEYRAQFLAGEKRFLAQVKAITGRGVSIFVDYIGSPVNRLTMKSLAREGVLTTAGWKLGMGIPVNRASECIKRHIHVFTHYVRASEVAPAVRFAEEHGWIPEDTMPVYKWDDIPKLTEDYRRNEIQSYYPLYEVTAP